MRQGAGRELTGYRADVQGLRAVAVVAVVLYHAARLLPGGYVGVDVFFVISGFVITRSLVREHIEEGQVSLRSFYRRRVRRLTPALTLVVAVTVTLSLLFGPIATLESVTRTGAASLLLVANHELLGGAGYFATTAELNPLLHTWSLSLEEQFYLVFPGLVVGALAVGRRRPRALVTMLVALGVLSLAVCLWLSHAQGAAWLEVDEARRWAFFLMPSRMWQFVVGALLACATVHDDRRLAVPGASVVGAGLVVASFVVLGGVDAYPGVWSLAPTLGTALVIADPRGAVGSLLSHRALVRAGDISYGWYLWHWPVLVFVGAAGLDAPPLLAVIGLATYVLAVLTHRFVEVPYTRAELREHRGDWGAIIATSLVAASLVAAAGSLPSVVDGLPDTTAAQAARQPHLDRTCEKERLAPGLRGCVLGDGARHVLLVGDSNAAHLAEAVVGAAETGDWRVSMAVRSGCVSLDVVVLRRGAQQERCEQHGEAMRDWVLGAEPDLVVFATAPDVYTEVDEWQLSRGTAEGVVAYQQALRVFVEQVEAVGADVVVVQPVPKFRLEDPRPAGLGRCSALVFAVARDNCSPEVSRDEAQERRAAAVAAQAAVGAMTSATVVDVFDTLCPGSTCRQRRAGVWLYRDDAHISVAAAQQLVPVFVEVLARVEPRTS